MDKKFCCLKIEDVFKYYETTKNGLTDDEAFKRLNKHGKNILPKVKKETILHVIFRQLNSPIMYLLMVSAVLSFLVGDNVDAIFIIFIIVLDLGLSTMQEWKAEIDARSLEKLIEISVTVLRNGKKQEIDSSLLVPGDIVYLSQGDKIGADIRLIEENNLQVDESLLTGESLPVMKTIEVDKDLNENDFMKNIVYAGTTIIKGRGIGVVISTGINTTIGKIATIATDIDFTKPPLVIRMEKFTKQISTVVFIIAILITILLYLKGYVIEEIFFAVIALCVSAIPEGLPIAMIVALSNASRLLARKNVLVKKLNCVESLGSCTIIASDKTGTLTLNQQTAKVIVLPNGSNYNIEGIGYNGEGNIYGTNIKEVNDLILMGVLNNEASLNFINKEWIYSGDSIDVAFLSLGYKANIIGDAGSFKKIAEIPYEAELKYSAGLYENTMEKFITIKGSFEVILDYCKYMRIGDQKIDIDINLLTKQNKDLASEGYRVIALCCKETESDDIKLDKNFTFWGLVGFIDPIREDVYEAIEKCKTAGVKVVMITGDHPLTAFSIAKNLNIANKMSEVATNIDVNIYYDKGEKEFDEFVKTKKVFTRVTPIQKLRIVESYKRQGEYIAVTGDGVNDALALKAANIGVAMGSGTDVAKETSSMIITDDNFKSIVNGIEAGRNAYNNIRKVTYMLLSTAVAEVLFFSFSIILNMPMPLIAIQILWLNIITNGIQDIALAFEKGEGDVMHQKPRNPNEKIFDKLLLKEMFLSGLFIGGIVFIVWYFLVNYLILDVSLARSYIVILMVFMQNIHTFNCRSEKKSAFEIPIKNNPFVFYSVLGAILLQYIVIKIPFFNTILKIHDIPFRYVIILFFLATPILLVMEIFKYRMLKRNQE
ncbi:MAG: HAD-IC family P-type ATPase [Mollicutes bacterium]|nr:HAD-IC family P-type ATPase [Mollicutes bacterium]